MRLLLQYLEICVSKGYFSASFKKMLTRIMKMRKAGDLGVVVHEASGEFRPIIHIRNRFGHSYTILSAMLYEYRRFQGFRKGHDICTYHMEASRRERHDLFPRFSYQRPQVAQQPGAARCSPPFTVPMSGSTYCSASNPDR
jgi:hypothetical protein